MAKQGDNADSTLTMQGRGRSGDIPPGTVIGGNLRIVSKIGSGGMGSVYLAVDTGPLGRSCAVKILDSDAAGASGHGRFLAEARIMASLRHPNIVAVSRFGTDDATGFDYYVMDEFLHTGDECRRLCRDLLLCDPPPRDGGKAPLTLADLIDCGRSLPEGTVVSVALQLLSAIDAAHSLPRPVVHRDIKPSNILFAGDGRAMLADFGIAKRLESETSARDATGWTMPNATPGTWMFAAPEQREGGAIVPATDFYSFGLVLFKALTGGMPSRTAALPTDVAPLVSKSWRGLFARLLEPDPAQRLADASRIAEILARIQDDIRRRERTGAALRRLPRFAAAVAVAAAVAAIAFVTICRPRGAGTPQPSTAVAETPRQFQGEIAETPQVPEEEDGEVLESPQEEEEFDHKKWTRQYADGLKDLLAKVLDAPAPDGRGRIVVPEGKVLLSGDIPESAEGDAVEIVLDGGALYFSPPAGELKGIVEECEDFIANAPDGASSPPSLLPTLRALFMHTVAVTRKGGHLDSVDGEIAALVAGKITCADGVDDATLSVFGFTSITLNRSSLDPRLKITGAGRIADISPGGSVRNLEWFD